ncbi:antitoxin Xre/MbcA/ParS toxin-binding domain-containing protein [Microbacterium sp. B2969]|uniref:Antitoxin Xre/MbcA/ParS toxin-binding domain-containing protein n=1 Tax=Microbacterium alkaliflavum TaxID=3248839 RepID=A0ABW7QDC5_9MICO
MTGDNTTTGESPLFGDDAARLGRTVIEESVAYDVAAVRARLRELWTDPAIDVWLTSTNSHLDGARPIDVLALTGVETVMDAIEVEVAGGSR